MLRSVLVRSRLSARVSGSARPIATVSRALARTRLCATTVSTSASVCVSVRRGMATAPPAPPKAQAQAQTAAQPGLTPQDDEFILEVTEANFNAVVQSGMPLILDMYADWCGP
jgi:hypothetical protein